MRHCRRHCAIGEIDIANIGKRCAIANCRVSVCICVLGVLLLYVFALILLYLGAHFGIGKPSVVANCPVVVCVLMEKEAALNQWMTLLKFINFDVKCLTWFN